MVKLLLSYFRSTFILPRIAFWAIRVRAFSAIRKVIIGNSITMALSSEIGLSISLVVEMSNISRILRRSHTGRLE